eukprot:350129-Chlamydomonas_euryale.AAC.2
MLVAPLHLVSTSRVCPRSCYTPYTAVAPPGPVHTVQEAAASAAATGSSDGGGVGACGGAVSVDACSFDKADSASGSVASPLWPKRADGSSGSWLRRERSGSCAACVGCPVDCRPATVEGVGPGRIEEGSSPGRIEEGVGPGRIEEGVGPGRIEEGVSPGGIWMNEARVENGQPSSRPAASRLHPVAQTVCNS